MATDAGRDTAPDGYRRVRGVVEYDGTDFVGWQTQTAEHGRTVQSVLEQAIAQVTGSATSVIAAGRTDAGVHATGQVIHFDTSWSKSLAVLQRAVSAVLPLDVVIVSMDEAAPDFHARFDAREREYVYTLLNQPQRSPLLRRLAWYVQQPLDIEAMRAATTPLIGRHDFRAFGRPMKETGSTIRTISDIQVGLSAILDPRFPRESLAIPRQSGFLGTVLITVRADAFLRHMVRRLVYAVVEAGKQRLTPEAVAAILASAEPHRLHGIAPPQGLCLARIYY